MLNDTETTFRSLPSADNGTCHAPALSDRAAAWPAQTPAEHRATAAHLLCTHDDETFATLLVAYALEPSCFDGLTLLYEPEVKARIAGLQGNERLMDGIILPGLRRLPGFREAAYLRALPRSSAAPAADAASIWETAMTAADFCSQDDDLDLVPHVKDLLLPGAITLIAAPRASFKSLTALALAVALATGGVFRGERLAVKRVLLVDRDNPPALVRKRMRALGADHITGLRVITRNKAPVLTDAAAWAAFPVDQYDVVIIDSIGAATEGISEKEGRQTQQFLATLKDLAHRGPAILGLDNTNKAGANIRGRGEKSDAVDIVYECRNVTGWTPSTGGTWWEHLPEYGEHTWQQRAARQHGQKVLRLAFIPSKFRLGVEPEPFCLEIDTRQDLWTLRDVTEEIATAGEANAQATRDQERHKFEAAAQALVAQLTRRDPAVHPMLKHAAGDILQQHGLSQKQARHVLDDGFNKDLHPQDGLWHLRHLAGSRGRHAQMVLLPQQLASLDASRTPVGEEDRNHNTPDHISPRNDVTSSQTIMVAGSTASDHNSASRITSNGTALSVPDFRSHVVTSQPKSAGSSASNGAVKTDGGILVETRAHQNDPCGDALLQQIAPRTDAPAPSAAALHHVAPDLWHAQPATGPVCARCHGQDFAPRALGLPVCRRCGMLPTTRNGSH